MQPLSPLVRRLYLSLFMLLFFAMLPAIIFYADGWRYKTGDGFVRTGGVYIGVPYPDARVTMNGIEIGQSGFLDRSFYRGDLTPGAFTIRVEREGYRSWNRVLMVEEQLVTDARALLVPLETPALRLVAATSSSTQNASTTIRIVPRATLTEYAAVFAAPTTASSTIPVDEQEGVGLFLERGSLVARWIRENSFPTSHFCERPSVCTDTIILENNAEVSTARFFRGGVVYATKSGEVHFLEVDVRQTPIHMLLFSIPDPDIRIIDDALIVKSGTTYYEISL